jgi:hypothetical protein
MRKTVKMGDDSEYPPAYLLDTPDVAVAPAALKALVSAIFFSPLLVAA